MVRKRQDDVLGRLGEDFGRLLGRFWGEGPFARQSVGAMGDGHLGLCPTPLEGMEVLIQHAFGPQGPGALSRQRRLHRRAPFYWAPLWEACLGRRLDSIAPANGLQGFLHTAIFQQNISHKHF